MVKSTVKVTLYIKAVAGTNEIIDFNILLPSTFDAMETLQKTRAHLNELQAKLRSDIEV